MFISTDRQRKTTLVIAGWAIIILGLSSLVHAQSSAFSLQDNIDANLVEVSALLSVESALAGQTYPAALLVDVAENWHINSSQPKEDFLIAAKLSPATVEGISTGNIQYPSGVNVVLSGQEMSVYDGQAIVYFDVSLSADLAAGTYQLPLEFLSQACNDRECRAPQTLEASLSVVVGDEGDPVHAGIFAGYAAPGQLETVASDIPESDSELQRLIDDHGAWGYVLALGLAFLTGLLLSFSPCTYPMIPITVSIFAGQQRSIGRGFFLSLVYVGTMATMYGLMGLIIASVGGVFGAWLASPPVVIGIVVVFVIFSLSMFGLYEFQVPASLRQKLGTRASGGGIGGSIVLGVIAALVVSPCVGPFVAGILLYVATSGSPLIGFLVLFFFALGLGTLYVLIGTFSSAINALPGSGEWMETVKKFFGFVLLMMAIYFLQTLVSPLVTALATGLLLVAFGVFGGGLDRLTSESGFFPRLKKLLGILALLVGLYLLLGTIITQGFILPAASGWMPGGAGTVAAEESSIQWRTDLESELALASKDNKPVLIDTWATWCVNCKVLEKKTFGHASVVAEAERFVSIKVQLEKAGSPETKAFMEQFGLKLFSLPTVLLLDGSGKVRHILQGVTNPDEMLALMREVR